MRTVGRASEQYSQNDEAAIYKVDKAFDQDVLEERNEPVPSLAQCAQCVQIPPRDQPSPPHLPDLPQSPSRPLQSPQADHSETNGAAVQVNQSSTPRTEAVPAPGEMMTPPSQGPQSSKPKLKLRVLANPKKRASDDSCGHTPAPTKISKKNDNVANVAADRGKAVLLRAEIDHGRTFQKCHQSHHCFIEPGHWSAFLTVVGKREMGHEVNILDYPCLACRELLQMCFPHESHDAAAAAVPTAPALPQKCDAPHVQNAQNVVDILDTSDEDSPPPKDQKNEKKRGRPPSNSPKFSLKEWIGRERPGVYTFLPAPSDASLAQKNSGGSVDSVPLQCNVCNSVFGAHRTSTNHWVLLHENADKHKDALCLQRAQTSKAGGKEADSQIVASSLGCNGISLRDLRSSSSSSGPFASDHMTRLARMVDVFQTWWAANCIAVKDDGTHHIHCGPSHADDPVGLVLRCPACKGSQACCLPCGWCVDCNAAVKKRKMLVSVSAWAFKIDASHRHVMFLLVIVGSACFFPFFCADFVL